MTTATDEHKRRAEMSSEIFGDRLRHFVRRWAPSHPQALHDFHMDLTRLMVDAMRNKSDCLSYGLATYADMQFTEMSMRPITVIMEEPKR